MSGLTDPIVSGAGLTDLVVRLVLLLLNNAVHDRHIVFIIVIISPLLQSFLTVVCLNMFYIITKKPLFFNSINNILLLNALSGTQLPPTLEIGFGEILRLSQPQVRKYPDLAP